MKATGVVRRIDDLGRIVIPKEIRKTLRIKEGTPLEIFTEKDGDIILKKYSPIGELSTFSAHYVESLANITNFTSIVTDKDSVIAISGAPKKDFLEQSISKDLEEIIEKRQIYIGTQGNLVPITSKQSYNDLEFSQVIVPIISDSEVIGSIVLQSKEPGKNITDAHVEIAKVAADFLGNQMIV